MPCHWGDRDLHIVSQSSPTGSQCLPAVGCAEAGRYIVGRDLPGCSAHGDEVTYVSLGEGACSEGEFWESLNSAARLGLPVLYVIADNGYAISVRASDQAPAPVSEMVMGIRGLHVTRIDGRDYFEVRKKGAEAIQRVRAGQGPGLIHATVTRPYSHSLSDDQKKYRHARRALRRGRARSDRPARGGAHPRRRARPRRCRRHPGRGPRGGRRRRQGRVAAPAPTPPPSATTSSPRPHPSMRIWTTSAVVQIRIERAAATSR